MAVAERETRTNEIMASVSVDVANEPEDVRAFDAMGRQKFQGQMTGEVMLENTSFRLSAGAQLKDWDARADFVPDGSYVARKLGGALIYAGYLTHWWGPGWISALSLSNNARPFPHVGIERAGTSAFKTPWLSWLGPWQAEFFVGLLDGPRIDKDTIYTGLRITLNPLPGLEIGAARTTMICGSHHPCKPLASYFDLRNDSGHQNETNEEGLIDIHYAGLAWGAPFELYGQVMNEDSNPITDSGSSHLAGGSLWIPIGEATARLTLEYSDSVATANIFSFGDVLHGFAYNNGDYRDGMRYRGRTLGFSLDSDSRLASIQASIVDANARTYTLTFHHARVSSIENIAGNVVSTAPVYINLAEARLSLPLAFARIDLAARYQDDRPRPQSGSLGSFEAALSIPL
jgi:hypothetical protein